VATKQGFSSSGNSFSTTITPDGGAGSSPLFNNFMELHMDEQQTTQDTATQAAAAAGADTVTADTAQPAATAEVSPIVDSGPTGSYAPASSGETTETASTADAVTGSAVAPGGAANPAPVEADAALASDGVVSIHPAHPVLDELETEVAALGSYAEAKLAELIAKLRGLF
jgi:hypothetical protein